MNSIQRNPNKIPVTSYVPLQVAAQIKTIIEGQIVNRMVRRRKNGKYIVNPNPMRKKTISDFMLESAMRRVKKVVPSKEALEWKQKQYEKNLERRRYADSQHKGNR